MRTFEASGIVPQLIKESPGICSRIISENSTENNEVESNASTKSVKTCESSNEIPTLELESLSHISSKKINKIAQKMLKESGFPKNSFLNMNDF